MIYFIDEDLLAFGAWTAELDMRNLEVECLWNANEAFERLCEIDSGDIDLAIIDVMLAVENVNDERYSSERTFAYHETGLRLLTDLIYTNPTVFPRCAVLLTNTVSDKIFREAKKTSVDHDVPLWKKADITSPIEFGDLVEERIREVRDGAN